MQCNLSSNYPIQPLGNERSQFFSNFKEAISQGSSDVIKFLYENIELMRSNPEWINIPIAHDEFDGATLLYFAVGNSLWDLVKEMVSFCPKDSFNATISNGPKAGVSLIWLTAYSGQWDIVREFLPSCSADSLNTTAQEGPDKGIPLIWLAAKCEQWDIVKKLLPSCSQESFNATPRAGPNRGLPLIWLAAGLGQWDLVKEILPNCSADTLNAVPREGSNYGISLIWMAVCSNQWEILKEILPKSSTANLDHVRRYAPEHIKLYVALLILNFEKIGFCNFEISFLSRFKASVVNATLPLLDLWHDHSQNLLMQLPYELKEEMALENLYHELPELRPLPRSVVKSKMMEIVERNNIVQGVLYFAQRAFPYLYGSAEEKGQEKLQEPKGLKAAILPDAQGPQANVIKLWHAANSQKWHRCAKLLKLACTSPEGVTQNEMNARSIAIWYASAHRQWDIVSKLLSNANMDAINIDLAPSEGGDAGKTALWYATRNAGRSYSIQGT